LAYVIFVDVVLDLSDDDRELGFLAGVVRVGVGRGFLIDDVEPDRRSKTREKN
jgi:hypothetical protein